MPVIKLILSAVALVLLAGCAKQVVDDYPKALSDAKDFISSTYPEAAALPAVVVDQEGEYAYYRSGVGYYAPNLIEKGNLELGCAMVHEYEHHKQYMSGGIIDPIVAEQAALDAGHECLRTLKNKFL